MKQIKTLLIATTAFIATSANVFAQKTAHIDVSEIVQNLPAMKDAQTQIEKLGATYESDFQKMVGEYQGKLKKYEAEASTVSELVNADRSKEVQDMQKRIQDFRETAQKELQDKESALVKPIMEKVKASIAKVGKAKGFQYVFDSSTLLLADGVNLTADVKKDLGF